ncbi:putative Xaa-Pro aminopeptidase [Smittium mucronatum]|uniref:Putative Xaa-Pro aminopeptidase n=1 Tax=Smittium mucronatum TaxID=133383 RepID=A0A1R0GL08_9FUNG|nr:putative Xaa-Pro aminopeptidase [Smittium mucronatum]
MSIKISKHCQNVSKYLGSEGAFYVVGAVTTIHPDSDTDSNMTYVSGVYESGFQFLYDLKSKESYLFAPYVSADEAVWIGPQPTLDDYKKIYCPDHIYYSTDFDSVLKKINPSILYRIGYQSTASLANLSLNFDSEKLLEAIHEARVFKEPEELQIMKIANDISGQGHVELMKLNIIGSNERRLYSKFVGHILNEGCVREAYTTIVGSGRNSATLHYIKNNAIISSDSELVLVDAGGSYKGYASDITRTWPVGKSFSEEAKQIYQIVLDMQDAVIQAAKPGVQWEDMHILANRIAVQGFLKLGIFRGDLDQVLESFAVGYFFPHGLGHFLGIDTHDCGGYPKGVERINKPGLRYLRVRRELLPGMVLTVEPGLYFVNDLIAEAKVTPAVSQFIDFDVVAKYLKIGGVRIEDNIVITEHGNYNLTNVPKKITDIEQIRCSN